jgi:hypothetical protein
MTTAKVLALMMITIHLMAPSSAAAHPREMIHLSFDDGPSIEVFVSPFHSIFALMLNDNDDDDDNDNG